jgi:hypothetical protein
MRARIDALDDACAGPSEVHKKLWTSRSKGIENALVADRGSHTWAPLQLSTELAESDTSCLGVDSETPRVRMVKDSVVQIESDGRVLHVVLALVNQGSGSSNLNAWPGT